MRQCPSPHFFATDKDFYKATNIGLPNSLKPNLLAKASSTVKMKLFEVNSSQIEFSSWKHEVAGNYFTTHAPIITPPVSTTSKFSHFSPPRHLPAKSRSKVTCPKKLGDYLPPNPPDGLHIWYSTLAPHIKLHSAVPVDS